MSIYKYLFVIICCTVAPLQSEITNVGTVLFSSSDIQKKHWKPSEVGLLQARRHFQTIIPDPHLINTDEDFISIMLNYFKECYKSLKKEAKDTETDIIMNTALSDAIGGFLKVWLLPTAKFAYYGGTVSFRDANKIIQFYDEIKTCLKTDGGSWNDPDINFLNSLTLSITPPKWVSVTRGVGDPCNELAFYEKTDSGLAIPIPRVNWDDQTASMFIPLKNQSLVSLHSSNTDSLFKYYNVATNCMEASTLEEQFKFRNRFQDWLAKEVIPHLSDEVLYSAFGNVLSLADNSKCVTDLTINDKEKILDKGYFTLPTFITSKKMLIIYLIVALEVVCCIPTLCYLIWVKVRKQKCKNVYLYIEKGRKGPKKEMKTCTDVRIHHSDLSKKTDQKPDSQDKECVSETPYLSTSSKQYLDSCTISTAIDENQSNFINERAKCPKKKSSNKIINDKDAQKSTTIITESARKETFASDESQSTSTIQLGASKTVTIVNERLIVNNRKDATERLFNRKQKLDHSVSASIQKKTHSYDRQAHNSESYVHKKNSSAKEYHNLNKYRQNEQKIVPNSVNQVSKAASNKTLIEQNKSELIKTSSDSPDIEITIDCQSLKTKIKPGHSKIPRKDFNIGTNINTTATDQKLIYSDKRKSLIPLPKRQKTSDGIVISKKGNMSDRSNLLNRTL